MDDGAWLLLSVATAGAPASTRVFVWRRLRGLGALYLQQSVCLLPDTPGVTEQIHGLTARVAAEGGSARVLQIRFSDPAELAAVVAEMRAARDEEYADLLERLPSFFAELTMETARGRASFVEVEESEADLARFRAWTSKIQGRDYFGGALREQVMAELDRAAAALAAFETAALAAEDAGENRAELGQAPRLRIVNPPQAGPP